MESQICSVSCDRMWLISYAAYKNKIFTLCLMISAITSWENFAFRNKLCRNIESFKMKVITWLFESVLKNLGPEVFVRRFPAAYLWKCKIYFLSNIWSEVSIIFFQLHYESCCHLYLLARHKYFTRILAFQLTEEDICFNLLEIYPISCCQTESGEANNALNNWLIG